MSATATTEAPTTTVAMTKGKVTQAWAQLPPEILRIIATYYIMGFSRTAHCPRGWDMHELWAQRMVCATIRDALYMERLIRVCTSWQAAIETHLFWQTACSVLDPNDYLVHYTIVRPNPKADKGGSAAAAAAAVQYLPPYTHFRNMLNCSCMVCRINHPYTNAGLTEAKRNVRTPNFGVIATCREHKRELFCGLCLRAAPPMDNMALYHTVGVVDNDDVETFPNIESTCRACRADALLRRVINSPRELEAVGGTRWDPDDWETRHAVDSFLDLGEGSINGVIATALEKQWLRAHTKLAEISNQAMAASRLQAREEAGYATEDDALSEDDEDDPELLELTEHAAGVKDLALNDWVRHRILDGHWVSPADQYYRHSVQGRPLHVPADHPCPWTLPEAELEEPCAHPREEITVVDVPPTFGLCEQAYGAYQKQMKQLLLPAMGNVVRKLVIECEADGVDPALKASRMSLHDVHAHLRDDGVWYNGLDWLERRETQRRQERAARREEEEESENSDTTSPVLSTTTLQTTPSPPPKDTKPTQVKIPVQPVLESPVPMHAIPYVPETLSHLPSYSMATLQQIWRDACTPLYQCHCSICLRAMAKAAGANPPPQVKAPLPERPASPPAYDGFPIMPDSPDMPPLEIALREEEEESEQALEEETQVVRIEGAEQEEEPSVAIIDLTSESDHESATPIGLTTPRKRSSHDICEEDYSLPVGPNQEDVRCKRARTGERYAPGERAEPNADRVRKRSSEELPDVEHDVDEAAQEALDRHGGPKKQRVHTPASGKLSVGDVARGPLAAPRTMVDALPQENDRPIKRTRTPASTAVSVDGGRQ